MQEYSNTDTNSEESHFDLKEQLAIYLRHWRWFVLSVFLLLINAFLYLRYATPQYKAMESILIKDEKKGGMADQLAAFADLGGLAGSKGNVDNEIEILKSRTLVESTVRALELNVSYFGLGRIKSADLYKDSPIEVVYSDASDEYTGESHNYRVKSISDSKFAFYGSNGEKAGEYSYGQVIKRPGAKLMIFKRKGKKAADKEGDLNIKIQIEPLANVTAGYRNRLAVAPLSKTTSVVELSFTDTNPKRAEDFLNTLVEIYNKNAIADKNIIAENTARFIEERLKFINVDLGDVEKETEEFKKSHRLTDLVSESHLFVENASDFQKKEIEIETQLRVVQLMTDYVKTVGITELIPANVIGKEGQAAELIGQYNQLILERNRLLKNAGPNNAVVLAAEAKIEALKESINSSLVQQKRALEVNRKDLARQNAMVAGKIAQMPTLEREARVLTRQQGVKEALYLYLLQKREENAITLAVTESNAKVIDRALTAKDPVSPKKNIILLAALLLGLLIPFGIIYVIDLLDTKIKSRLDIEKNTNIPFVGDVPKSDSPDEIIRIESRSSSAEAMRIIRTNLEFMVSKVQDGVAKTIFLTSTFPKEGKTFVSVNLAATFALSGKKVLLIGMDIRNPRLDDYLTLPSRGLTNYLSSKDVRLEDLLVKQDGFDDFYVLPAGVVPPNPAELLMSKKVDDMFETFKKQFDYIIVDTAPVSLVTDTLLVAKNADCFIYVARANFLEKNLLRIPNTLYKEGKLPNLCMLLNDTSTVKGYGYGYGYGYGVEVAKNPWYKRILKK